MVCFQNITAALLWCFTIQLQLLEVDWPVGILETEEGREIEEDGITIYRGLSVRMGIHWGTPVFERNPITNRMDYFGPVVNKASRICNAADGGQICVSSDVLAALRNILGVFNEEPISISDECVPVQESTPAFLDTTTSTGGFSIAKDVQQLKTLGFHVMELGERRLKGLETPEMLSFVYPKQLSGRMEINKNKVLVDPSVSATRNLGDPDLFTTEKDVVLDEKEIPNLLDLFQQPSLARTRANRPLSGRTIDPASRNVLPHTATTGGSCKISLITTSEKMPGMM
ncbi:nucleotide cyclase, partial [Spinellus fusiger]